jgi:hypothetical protein
LHRPGEGQIEKDRQTHECGKYLHGFGFRLIAGF